MSDGTDILTQLGLTKIRDAAGSDGQVRISSVALGDGNGANYQPDLSQTALRRELARNDIETTSELGDDAWRVKVSFGPDTPAFTVREMGFFDADGDLIALWAGTDIGLRQTGVITYLVDHVIQFVGVSDNLLVVEVPNDEVFELAVASAAAISNLQLEQLRQADTNHAEHGYF